MNKVSYLKGLLDGFEINPESREGKIFNAICEALEESAKYTEELENRVAELEELCNILDEDLGIVEEMIEDNSFSCTNCGSQTLQYNYTDDEIEAVEEVEEKPVEDETTAETEEQENPAETKTEDIENNNAEDTEEFLEDGEEEYETICPTCGHCILLDEHMLEEGETICPNCGEELEFDFDAEEIEKLAPADEE